MNLRVVVAIVLVAVLAGSFVWSLLDATRHPDRHRRLFDERRRRRAHVWVWAVTGGLRRARP
jgi:uncharacterized protein HemY